MEKMIIPDKTLTWWQKVLLSLESFAFISAGIMFVGVLGICFFAYIDVLISVAVLFLGGFLLIICILIIDTLEKKGILTTRRDSACLIKVDVAGKVIAVGQKHYVPKGSACFPFYPNISLSFGHDLATKETIVRAKESGGVFLEYNNCEETVDITIFGKFTLMDISWQMIVDHICKQKQDSFESFFGRQLMCAFQHLTPDKYEDYFRKYLRQEIGREEFEAKIKKIFVFPVWPMELLKKHPSYEFSFSYHSVPNE
ncbi:MAG: hypothetical protein WCT18_02870 [Patescibacteria group bacterium]